MPRRTDDSPHADEGEFAPLRRPRHAPRSAGIRPELLTVAIILGIALVGLLSGGFERPPLPLALQAAHRVRASERVQVRVPLPGMPRLVSSGRSFGRSRSRMPKVRLPRGPRGWSQVLRTDDLCPITPSWRRWGRVATVRELVRAAWLFHGTENGRLALADVSRRGGGYFPPHLSHRVGMDVDLRPARRDGRQCIYRTTWRSRTYDRRGTRELIRAIRAAANGHLRFILFDDPVLIRAGLTRYWPGHDNHLHVSFCSPGIRHGPYACPRSRGGGHGHHPKHHPNEHHANKHHANKHHRKKHHVKKQRHSARKRHRHRHTKHGHHGHRRNGHRNGTRRATFIPLAGAENFGLDGYVLRGFGYPFFK